MFIIVYTIIDFECLNADDTIKLLLIVTRILATTVDQSYNITEFSYSSCFKSSFDIIIICS